MLFEYYCIIFFETISAGILRYLGGRFPETTAAFDENGRTALHYAATIKDNGHFYNLLVHLGSNPKAIDKVTIEKRNKIIFFFTIVYKQLHTYIIQIQFYCFLKLSN